jgi:Acetyltransferase (GNAT) domain
VVIVELAAIRSDPGSPRKRTVFPEQSQHSPAAARRNALHRHAGTVAEPKLTLNFNRVTEAEQCERSRSTNHAIVPPWIKSQSPSPDSAMALEPGVRLQATECAHAIFQQPWWLDALAPGRWGEATIERNGRTVARLPYVVRGRGRWRMLTQPRLTQTLGPWIERSNAKPANALADEIELLTSLEAALPAADAFTQQFSPTMMNALPFYWAGYRLEVRYTYRLVGLGLEEALWAGLRGNIRGQIRKARKSVEVRDDLGLDRFHATWAKTFARQGLRPPLSLVELEHLDSACAARGARAILFAADEADRVHAVAYTVWDDHAAYYLLSGGDPDLRTSGAGSLLAWESIMRARALTDVFDFEGSMIKPVERFFRDFGGRQVAYLRVSRASPLGRTVLAARAGWHHVAGNRDTPGYGLPSRPLADWLRANLPGSHYAGEE